MAKSYMNIRHLALQRQRSSETKLISQTPIFTLIMWDWRSQPKAVDIEMAVKCGARFFRSVNSDDDTCVIVATPKKISKHEAEKLFRKHLNQ